MSAGYQGAPAEVDAVLARFSGELSAYIHRRIPGPDADDVLQDTLLRLYQGLGSLRQSERLAPYVYRVAKSAITDHYRRSRVARTRIESLPPEASPDASTDEPEDALREALAACVTPFMSGLPAEQAEALRLTDLGGLSQAEAARRLDVPVATLKARVQRGRKRMRASFDACCALEQDRRGAVITATPKCGCA